MSTDWLRALEGPDYVWEQRAAPAGEEEVAELAVFFGQPLPEDYAAFLRATNGGYLPFKDRWEIRFWIAGRSAFGPAVTSPVGRWRTASHRPRCRAPWRLQTSLGAQGWSSISERSILTSRSRSSRSTL